VTIPTSPVAVPDVVARLARGALVRPVWRNELGGVTFEIGAGPDREYVKVSPAARPGDLTGEERRLRWAGRFVAVPRVLGVGPGWLHTAGLPGESAVAPRWLTHPRAAARAIGAGLRTLHDRLPVDQCPFDWSVPTRLSRIRPELRGRLTGPPPVDRLVVCHGDACAPNTLIGADGRCSGHVDLDALGVADRWADLAVATMSLGWNYAGSWEDELLDSYGVAPDPARIAYYRLLWNAPEVVDG
jgi:kanamycin kinase